jgi:AAHS family 4-hydroxybenzoate transporter-like MFS transporter
VTQSATAIDLTSLLDREKVGRFHIAILLLCGLCCFASGFFTVALGFIAPVATAALGLGPGALGPAFSAMGLGAILGSFICTPLADRFGRKPVLFAGLLFATPFLFLIGTAQGLVTLIVGQFCAGFGLMGTVPIALALAGEFMPKQARVTLTTLVWIGFNLGSIVTGFVAARLAIAGDWHVLFRISGAMCLVIAPVAAMWLPESLEFLAERHASARRIAATLQRLDPRTPISPDCIFILAEKEEKGFPVSLLFREGRAHLTLLLWLMFFANIATLVFINSWLATILVSAGIAKTVAILIAALTNAGGIFGGIIVSELCDRWEARRFSILGAGFLLGSLCVGAIGATGNHAAMALIAALLAGVFTFGTQNTANAVAATIYPTTMRSTGAGWAIGIGNSAQIFSPLLAGFLLSLHSSTATVLVVMALPGLGAAFVAWRLGRSA